MATISELVVKIAADISAFQADMNTAITQFDKLTKASNVTAQKMQDLGKKITLGVTVPILAAGAAMVKMASETQDSMNAVNVIFKSGANIIKDYGKIAAESAGLSQSAFNDVANSMGVLLAQTGNSMEEVAQNTITLTQRSADLASLLGGTTKEAAMALGAALRGEAEPARRYGVILSESAMKAKALQMGLEEVNGTLTDAQRVQVRYAIIMEQSARANGDFANTNKDAKNSSQVLMAQISNLTADIGGQLLPMISSALTKIRDLVKTFSDMSDAQKQTILVVMGLAASIGPLLTGIGGAIKAINGLGVAFKFLGATGGPIAIAITAIVGIGVALHEVDKRIEKLRIADVSKRMKAFGDIAGITAEQIDEIELSNLQEFSGLINVTKEVAKLSEKLGLTESQVLKVAIASDKIAPQYKAQLVEMQKVLTVAERYALAEETATESALVRAGPAARKAAQDAQAALDKAAKAAQDATDKATRAAQTAKDKADKAAQDRLDAIEREKQAQEELAERTKNTLEYISDQEDEAREKKWAAEVEAQKKADALGDKIVSDAIENEKKIAAAKKQFTQDAYATVKSLAQDMFSVINDGYDLEQDKITATADIEKQAVMESKLSEEDKAAAIDKIDKRVAHDKAVIANDQAKFQKAQSLIQVGISTAEAIVKGYAMLGPVGGSIAAIALAALGAAQANMIIKTPLPPIPAYARGTDFAMGGMSRINEEGGEIVNMPRGSSVIPATRTPVSGGGMTVNIYSPVAVNPSEAAAIMKQTGRQMAYNGAMA